MHVAYGRREDNYNDRDDELLLQSNVLRGEKCRSHVPMPDG